MKRNVNSDDQQSHKYQQNEQSPLFPNHWTQKGPRHITLEIQTTDWYGHKNVAVLTLKSLCIDLCHVTVFLLNCVYFRSSFEVFFVQRTFALTFTPRPKYILSNKNTFEEYFETCHETNGLLLCWVLPPPENIPFQFLSWWW